MSDQVQEVFSKFDADGNGEISSQEMARVLTKLNKTLTREDCDRMFQRIDVNGDGTLQWQEFVDWMFSKTGEDKGARAGVKLAASSSKTMDASKKAKLRGKFAHLDTNGNGTLDFVEVYDFLHKRYPTMQMPDLKFLYECADRSGDGQLDFYELLDMIMAAPMQKLQEGEEVANVAHPLTAAIVRKDAQQDIEDAKKKEEEDFKMMMGQVRDLSDQLQKVRDADEQFKVWRDERQRIMREHYAKTGQLRW